MHQQTYMYGVVEGAHRWWWEIPPPTVGLQPEPTSHDMNKEGAEMQIWRCAANGGEEASTTRNKNHPKDQPFMCHPPCQCMMPPGWAGPTGIASEGGGAKRGERRGVGGRGREEEGGGRK